MKQPRTRNGRYLRESGVLVVASILKGSRLGPGDSAFIDRGCHILLNHEHFHFEAEVTCALAVVFASLLPMMHISMTASPGPQGGTRERLGVQGSSPATSGDTRPGVRLDEASRSVLSRVRQMGALREVPCWL
jgi:hypothetical protein